jgi:hypothetical protein
VTPAPTQTPTAGPLAEVAVTLVPGTSDLGFQHAFTVHIVVRETRGAAITAHYLGVYSPAGGYLFPNRETGGGTISVPPGGTISVPPFATATMAHPAWH